MGFTTSLLPSFAGGSGGAIASGNAAASAGESQPGAISGGFAGLFSLLQGAVSTPSAGAPAGLASSQTPVTAEAAALAADGMPLPAGGAVLPPLAALPGAGASGEPVPQSAEDAAAADPLAALAALGWRQRLNGEGATTSGPAEPAADDGEALTAGDSSELVDPALIDPALVGGSGQLPPPPDATVAAVLPTGPRGGAVSAGLMAAATQNSATGSADALALAALPPGGEGAAGGHGAAAGDPAAATAGTFGELVQALESEATSGEADALDSAAPATAPSAREPAGRTTAAPATAAAQVSVPVGRPGWSEAVMEKVMWFSSQLIDSAEIQLSPPELGPVQVRISTQHEQASVYFASHNASVREVLEQALPRLRELFESQGLQLADAGVGERGFSGQRDGPQGQAAGSDAARGYAGGDGGEPAAEAAPTLVRVGLVDAYA